MEWLLRCRAKMSHFHGFGAVVTVWRKKLRADEIDTSSCILDIYGSAHGCRVITIAEAKLARRFGTYCSFRLIRRK